LSLCGVEKETDQRGTEAHEGDALPSVGGTARFDDLQVLNFNGSRSRGAAPKYVENKPQMSVENEMGFFSILIIWTLYLLGEARRRKCNDS
jgi:hypothetical protein